MKLVLLQSIFFMGNIQSPETEIEIPDKDAQGLLDQGVAKVAEKADQSPETEIEEATRKAGQVDPVEEQDPFELNEVVEENLPDEVVSLSDLEESVEKPKTGKKK